MIQDIAPHKLNNHYIPGREPVNDSTVMVFEDSRVLCQMRDGRIHFPQKRELSGTGEYTYLFEIDQKPFFLAQGEDILTPAGYDYVSIWMLRKNGAGPKYLIFAAITACQLARWYRNNRFCGRCGGHMAYKSDERAMICPKCRNVVYPKIVPAVIVGVTDGDRLLLTKYADRDLPFYALVAGFTEIGETLEETVEREVMEEVGLKVTNIRYYKSQPWGIVDDILAGFYCDVKGDPTIHLDRSELKTGIWIKRDQIPGQPDDYSLTNEMMLAFRDGKV